MSELKLDILCLGAHPDDVELGCAGTILSQIAKGHKVGVVDFTRGEMGTRGTVATRNEEAAAASQILGLSARENLDLADGFFENDKQSQLALIRVVRKYRPEIIIANAPYDRHSDHGRACQLAIDACFLSGLEKVVTMENGKPQWAWRPKVMYHYIQSQLIVPDIIVDISAHWEKKMESIRAYKTQFYDPKSQEPETFISNPQFISLLQSRATEFGSAIGVRYGEGFKVDRLIGVRNLFDLI